MLTQEHINGMIKLYNAGATQEEAASAFGHKAWQCAKALKILGFKSRDTRWSETYKRTFTARKYLLDESFFENINTEAKAYWLGFITADGSLQTGRYKKLYIVLASKDADHLKKFYLDIRSNAPVKIYNSLNKQRGKFYSKARITIVSSKLIHDLCSLGLSERKQYNAKAWKGSNNLISHYWRGLIDGDGSIFNMNGYWSISLVGSYRVCRSYSKFIGSIINKSPSVRRDRNIWQCVVSSQDNVKKIITYLYHNSTVYLDRKMLLANLVMHGTPHGLNV